MKKFRIILPIVIIFSCIQSSFAQHSFETWRFINIPDYHKSEGLAINTDAREERIAEQREGFIDMYQKHGGELITIPGDIVSGHWYHKKYLTKFKKVSGFEHFTTSEVVSESCKRSFSGVKQIIHEAGYKDLLIAVGDHEIGDNPWGKNSEVVKHIPTFRKGFANAFTMDKNGQSRFTKKIGNASPRPVGTKYEHTSNAYQHKNILFITLDMFRFDAKDNKPF